MDALVFVWLNVTNFCNCASAMRSDRNKRGAAVTRRSSVAFGQIADGLTTRNQPFAIHGGATLCSVDMRV
jgi:hypothetical protein